jgi:uncharacterized LabA/DUF88 family protein
MTEISKADPERVVAYIDRYNLYYGLTHKNWRRYLWLDIRGLFEREMTGPRHLVGVVYFTALGRKQSVESDTRQRIFLGAMEATGVEVIRGKFDNRPVKCPVCSETRPHPKEKMTDVAIAVQLLADAYEDRCDTAWLMSADSDLVPAVRYYQERFPAKKVVILPPRGRRSDELIAVADAKRDISRSRFAQAQLPTEVTNTTTGKPSNARRSGPDQPPEGGPVGGGAPMLFTPTAPDVCHGAAEKHLL